VHLDSVNPWMTRIPKLLDGLRSLLRRRGISYAQLAKRLRVSESTVKRMFSRGVVSVARLEQTCAMLEIDIVDLAKEASTYRLGSAALSAEQERALASDAVLFAVFHLLLNEWTADRIVAAYSIDEPALISLLARLDRLGLIELKPGNLVRLRVSPRLSWDRQRRVRLRYESLVRDEFLASSFDRPDEVLRFEVRELTRSSIVALQEKIERLAEEVQKFAEGDALQPIETKLSVGCLLAARPWVFSVVAALQRRVPAVLK